MTARYCGLQMFSHGLAKHLLLQKRSSYNAKLDINMKNYHGTHFWEEVFLKYKAHELLHMLLVPLDKLHDFRKRTLKDRYANIALTLLNFILINI